jgi:hypothetical protein
MPPPVPTIAEFIRSGMASAMNSNTSPPAPSLGSNGDNRAVAAVANTGRGGSGSTYRPHGVFQIVSFNAAKALGKAANIKRGGNGDEDE